MHLFKLDDRVTIVTPKHNFYGWSGRVVEIDHKSTQGYIVEFAPNRSDWIEEVHLQHAPTPLPLLDVGVGDMVEAFGCFGVVTEILSGDIRPIVVAFNRAHNLERFTADGRLHMWNTNPSLKFLKRKETRLPNRYFKVGDKVEAFGVPGVVTSINGPVGWNVEVEFENVLERHYYTFNGRATSWANEPALKLRADTVEFDGNFMVGDKVRYKGIEGRVVDIFKSDDLYPVMVTLKGQERAHISFSRDGKFLISDPNTSKLEFVSRG